jgi:hypothetical protein
MVGVAVLGLAITVGIFYYNANSNLSKAQEINAQNAQKIANGDPTGYGTMGQGDQITDYMKDVSSTAQSAAGLGAAAGGLPVSLLPADSSAVAAARGIGTITTTVIKNWDQIGPAPVCPQNPIILSNNPITLLPNPITLSPNPIVKLTN